MLLAIGCNDVDDDASTEQDVAMGIEGNAPGYGYNAPGYGYNAPDIGVNAPGYGYNAPGYGYNAIGYGPNDTAFVANALGYGPDGPGYAPSANGLANMHAFGDVAGKLVRSYEAGTLPWYLVTNALTPIVQPQPVADANSIPIASHVGVGCTAATDFTHIWTHGNGSEPIRNWKFARSYRDSSGNIRSSEIWVETTPGAWRPLTFTHGSAFRFPAKVTSVGATTAALDAIVEITAPPVTGCYYECTPRYRVRAYQIKIALVRTDLGDGQKYCFEWVDLGLSSGVPAVNDVLTGLQPRGDGWAMLVSAHANSAVFKAANYAQAILDFRHSSDVTNHWRYRYPLTNAACDAQPASCVDGATLLASYTLAITNIIPFQYSGNDPATGPYTVLAGHPGTITGQAVYISATRDNRALRLTDLETPGVRQEAEHLKPGTRESNATPFPYDAAIGPPTSSHACLGSARAAVGDAGLRVDALGASNEVMPEFRAEALNAYNTCKTGSLISPASIWSVSTDVTTGGAMFATTAMPASPIEPACVLVDGARRVEVFGARFFCSPPPNPPPTGNGSNGSGT
ncbi:MAG TPA: hypothetical protein VIV11_31565 [Kofleriaceae bacterium]